MMGSVFGNAVMFLINIFFDLYILAVLLRFLFQLVNVDFFNPFYKLIVVVTNPPVLMFRRFFSPVRRIDIASIVLLVGLEILRLYLLAFMAASQIYFAGAVLLGIGELLKLTVYVIMFAVFIRIILSWVAPYGVNPLASPLVYLTDPLLVPARRIIRPIEGIDLSPIGVFIFLGLILIILVGPILDFGAEIAYTYK